MSSSPTQTQPPFSGSLLDDPALAPAPPVVARPRRPFLPPWLARSWRTPRVRWTSLGVLALGLGLAAFLYLRPVPQPNFTAAPMDDVLEYALLTEDFNKLPIEKRLDLIKELVARIKGMSGEDSVLMATFAAAVEGKMREQLERNVTLLAVDMWDSYAWEYTHAPADKRAEQIEKSFLDLTKTLEAVAGVQSSKTDAERLAEARDQAKRDQDMFASGKGPTGMQLARMATGMRQAMLKNGSPQQQARAQQLMRDMTRYLRGQDPATGK